MRRLVVVRHAETGWSRAGRHTGRSDIPLTDAGREAARALGPLLRAYAGSLALASPLSRAAETARLAEVDAEPEPDLVEWDYGAYEGRTTADIRAERPGWLLWRDGVPDGETPADVAARVDRVIARALAHDGDTLVVAHGHALRMLAARWLEQPPEFGARLALDPGHLGVLGFEREVRGVRAWNAGPSGPAPS